MNLLDKNDITQIGTDLHNLLTPAKRLEVNYKRSKKVSGARIKNIDYAKQIEAFGKDMVIDDEKINEFLNRYSNSLYGCSCQSLYRKMNGNNNVSFIGSKTCNHRLCNVCNMLRANKMRRKWRAFFASDERNVLIKQNQTMFYPDLDTHCTYVEKRSGELKQGLMASGRDMVNAFDFMHLTLTVPHTNGTWRGKRFYAKELIQIFNSLRERKWWKQLVFGGEQTVEIKYNNGSPHIHIHALLMVDKATKQSRNSLYVEILKRWNKLTVDTTLPASNKLEAERYNTVLKSVSSLWLNKENQIPFLTMDESLDVMNSLDARGSTMIGLKSLYYEITAQQYSYLKFGKFMQDGKFYRYCSGNDEKSLTKGIVECLKYHFEPCVVEDANGDLDIPLLCEVLPNIYRQRLYAKFGGLNGVKQLNVVEEPLNDADEASEMASDAGATATNAFDARTGQPLLTDDYRYIIVDAGAIKYSPQTNTMQVIPSRIKFTFPEMYNRNMNALFLAFTTAAIDDNQHEIRERNAIRNFEKFE